ncbi:hypothetical protein [Streptomyces sp. NPDC057694]|uniref:hypothetical protein n=1 Tax=Streptomyces sp. NPDC057694 TaxID=3346216 RepID=UPI0036858543
MAARSRLKHDAAAPPDVAVPAEKPTTATPYLTQLRIFPARHGKLPVLGRSLRITGGRRGLFRWVGSGETGGMSGMGSRGRWALVSVGVMVVVLGAVPSGGPAVADGGGRLVDVSDPVFYVPLGPATGQTPQDAAVRFRYTGDGSGGGRAGKVRFDVRGLAGVAEVTGVPDGCTGEKTPVVTCGQTISEGPEPYRADTVQQLGLAAVAGAKAGETGVLRYTLISDDGSLKGSGSLDVVAGSPRLLVSDTGPRTAERGEDLSIPLFVRNAGDVTARGLYLSLDPTEAMAIVGRAANCWYGKAQMYCVLPDIRIAPGQTVRIDPPLRVTPRPEAVDPLVSYAVGLGTEYVNRDPLPDYTRGKGAPLRATPAAAPDDVDFLDPSRAQFDVTVANTSDYAAIGADITGRVGSRVNVVVGYVNKGPGVPRDAAVKAVFTVPPGAKVVAPPYDPELDEEMLPQHCKTSDRDRTYVCELSDGLRKPQEFAFALRITGDDDRPGSVTVRRSGKAPEDPVSANDRAPVRLTVTGPAPATAATARSDTSPVVWAAAVGGTAVLLTAGLVLLRRRREAARTKDTP